MKSTVLDNKFEIDIGGSGEKASAIGGDLMNRLVHLNDNERLKNLLEANRGEINDLAIYLLEPSVNTEYTRYPHFLTIAGKQFEIANSGTNQGTEQAVYIMRAAFTDLDTRLLVDILLIQYLKLNLDILKDLSQHLYGQ